MKQSLWNSLNKENEETQVDYLRRCIVERHRSRYRGQLKKIKGIPRYLYESQEVGEDNINYKEQ